MGGKNVLLITVPAGKIELKEIRDIVASQTATKKERPIVLIKQERGTPRVKIPPAYFVYDENCAVKLWEVYLDGLHERCHAAFAALTFIPLPLDKTTKFITSEKLNVVILPEVFDIISHATELVAQVEKLMQRAAFHYGRAYPEEGTALGASSSEGADLSESSDPSFPVEFHKKEAFDLLVQIFENRYRNIYIRGDRKGLIGLCQDLFRLAIDMRLAFVSVVSAVVVFL